MTVYVVAIPWDSYRVLGAEVFETYKQAEAYCDSQNAKQSYTLFVSECVVNKQKKKNE